MTGPVIRERGPHALPDLSLKRLAAGDREHREAARKAHSPVPTTRQHTRHPERIFRSNGVRKPESMLRSVIDSQVPGLGLQVSGSGIQHQVQVQARARTRTRRPAPDTRSAET